MPKAKKSPCTTLAEDELNKMHIKYDKNNFSSGILYFCTLPNGLTFDLFAGKDGTIRLWRFVSTMPVSKAGTCLAYRDPRRSHISFGFEVTEEGDLCFYAELAVDAGCQEKGDRIHNTIELYSALISEIDFKSFKL